MNKAHVLTKYMNKAYVTYRMAGNFRGVLIFVIFVVDVQSRNFPPTKINAYGTGDMSP